MCRHRVKLTNKEIELFKSIYGNFSYDAERGVKVGFIIGSGIRLEHGRRCVKCGKLIRYIRETKVRVG